MNRFHLITLPLVVSLWLSVLPSAETATTSLPIFDFTQASACTEWGQPHHITALRHTSEGLEVTISGMDPYFFGPPCDYPQAALWLDLKLRSETGGGGQVFWFTQHPTEENSVHFQAQPGEWENIRLPLPPLAKGTRLRIDPPGTSGKCVIASARFAAQPTWEMPKPPSLPPLNKRIVRKTWMTLDYTPVAYVRGDKVVWFNPGTSAEASGRSISEDTVQVVATDPDGGQWTFTKKSTEVREGSEHELESSVTLNQNRDVLFLPILFLGLGHTNKLQALFPGLEYLDDEPSSSEADLIGPAATRYVPDPVKITQPYIAVLANHSYLATLTWEPNPRLAAFFDSPDRTFGTGAHVVGLVFPGFNGRNRTDGRWLPNQTARLTAGETLTAKAILKLSGGQSVAPAIRDYVQVHGFPAMPAKTPKWNEYLRTAAGGWLDSKIREEKLVRHALWQGFGAGQAADAAAYMEWLACQSDDPQLKNRLTNTAAQVLSAVPPAQWASAGVGHVRMPMPALVYGHVAENQRTARTHARHLLARFTPEGFVPYKASAGQEDYGRTYHTNHANGLTAQVSSTLLEEAAFSGDKSLIQESLAKVRALKTLYANSVPRGAQTWEVPLHTPDILASAYLIRANALAYELTGDDQFREEARYWAWTGVPFVYLVNPVEKDIATYTTIAVFGATGWRAPVWMGLPVQWCGLVYADALYRLGGDAVPGQPWQKLADGITAAGIQVTWPTSDKERQGLLPDSFLLREQRRDGPAINPGTLQACAPRYYRKTPLYECRGILRAAGTLPLIIHAPGEISIGRSAPSVEFTVKLWPKHPAWVLVNGVMQPPRIKLNGQAVTIAAPHEYDKELGSLRLYLQGEVKVEME